MVTLLACPAQFLSNAGAAVDAALGFIDRLDLFGQLTVSPIPGRGLAFEPAVIPAAGHFQYPAQLLNRIIFGKLFDHVISRLDGSETIAMVFFKISRCMIARASSLRSS